jgi:hypothetical protein
VILTRQQMLDRSPAAYSQAAEFFFNEVMQGKNG